MTEAASHRALGSAERLMWMADRVSPLNFVLVARIKGELTFEAVRKGIGGVLHRYPTVGLSIEDKPGAPPRLVSTNRPIPFDVVGADNWADQAVRTLNTPFDCPDDPLIRVRWLRGEEDGYILLTLHHSIADGRAGAWVLRELLHHTSAALQGHALTTETIPPGPPLEARELAVPPTKRLPVAARGERFVDTPPGSGPRRSAIIPHCFDQDVTTRIRAAARQAGCTVHGLLGATHLKALAQEHDAKVSLSLSSPIDLRRRITPFTPGELGLFVGNAHLVYLVDPEASPWGLARRISADVKRAAEHNDPLATQFGGSRRELKRLYEGRASTAMSNLGVLDISPPNAPFEVGEVHFAVACSTMGDQIVTVASHGGKMTWSLCPAVPTISLERAHRVAENSVSRLMAAIERPGYS